MLHLLYFFTILTRVCYYIIKKHIERISNEI